MHSFGDILMIDPWKTDKYYQKLKLIREGNYTIKSKLAEVSDPFEIHHNYVGFIPSYQTANSKAQKGQIYCWYCGSNHITKAGKVSKSVNKFSFDCHDCHSQMSYNIEKPIYDAFKGIKQLKKGQKIKYY